MLVQRVSRGLFAGLSISKMNLGFFSSKIMWFSSSRMISAASTRWTTARSPPFLLPTNSDTASTGEFESYRSGAWLYNDTLQRSNRVVKFDVAALIAVAVQAAGASSCTSFKFLADGTFNRLFDIHLDNGVEVVAKLPFIVAGPAHLTTASEVATMMFARDVLALPVPRVHTWCSRAEESAVGWEYIIMEKVPGAQLVDRWTSIRGKAVRSIMDDLVAAEQKMTDTTFGMLGSLYLAEDLPDGVGSPALRFAASDKTMPRQYKIGPSVDRRFWRGARAHMDIDRGPWSSYAAYARAIANCEIAWLQAHARPHAPTSPLYRSPTENDPHAHIALLQDYLAVIGHFIPPRKLRAFTLWHPDLHASNIIVTPPPAELPRIEAIIDWQTARIEPLLQAGTIPDFIEYEDGEYVPAPPPGLTPTTPRLPSNFDTLDAAAQRLAEAELREAGRYELFTVLTEQENPSLHTYRTFDDRNYYTWQLYWASRTWDEGTALLEKWIIEVCDEWEDLLGTETPCPISISDKRRAEHVEAMRRFVQEREIELLISEIGVQEEGWVTMEKLDDAIRRNEEVRENFIAELEKHDRERVRRCWPFQDGALSLTAEACR
ncbi:kinase-like domain-containing protein [Mycena sp. CBHHK59/15]|nr:kinase-like domain-containing protein [Mycena sp. CBHHK59/15]